MVCSASGASHTSEAGVRIALGHDSHATIVGSITEELVSKDSTPDVQPAESKVFAFKKGLLTQEAAAEVLRAVPLGTDPSSKHFAARLKSIRFVTVIGGNVKCFTQDYFAQHAGYNDFSGGYARHYTLIPDEILAGPLADVILGFTKHFDLPEKTCLLVQIQETTLVKRSNRESVTGQGIHSDGTDAAAIICLHRGRGVSGVRNQFHGKLDGSQALCEPTVLETGDAAIFRDNAIYHLVTPGVCAPTDDADDSKRTIMLIHSPAEHLMNGTANGGNTLGTNASSIKLREQ